MSPYLGQVAASSLFADPWIAEQRTSLRRYLGLDRCVWAWVERAAGRDADARQALADPAGTGLDCIELNVGRGGTGLASLASICAEPRSSATIVIVRGLDDAVADDLADGTHAATLAALNLRREEMNRPGLRWVLLMEPATLGRLRESAPDLYRFGQHFDWMDESDLIDSTRRAAAIPRQDLRREEQEAAAAVKRCEEAGVGGAVLAQALAVWAQCLGLIGEPGRGLDVARRGLAAVGGGESGSLRPRLLYVVTSTLVELGRLDEARASLRDFVGLQADPARPRYQWAAVAAVAGASGDLRGAIRAHRRTQASALDAAHWGHAGFSLLNLANRLLETGEVDAAGRALWEAQTLLHRAPDSRAQVFVRATQAQAALLEGRAADARSDIVAALAVAQSLGAADFVLELTTLLVGHLSESGRPRDALAAASSIAGLAESKPVLAASLGVLRRGLLADLGQRDEAPITPGPGSWESHQEDSLAQARHAEASGDLHRARALLAQTEESLRVQGYRLLLVDAQRALARRRRLDGDLHAADALLATAMELPARHELSPHLALVLAERALLRAGQGRVAEALHDAREGLVLTRRTRARRSELIVQSALGAVLRRAGLRDEAQTHSARAARFLEAIGALGLAAEVTRGLAPLVDGP